MTGRGVGARVWARLITPARFGGCTHHTDVLASAQSSCSSLGADGGGNLSTKNWLSTWGLRKMSNFSEHLTSVGKYIRKIKLDTIVPHSKVPPSLIFMGIIPSVISLSILNRLIPISVLDCSTGWLSFYKKFFCIWFGILVCRLILERSYFCLYFLLYLAVLWLPPPQPLARWSRSRTPTHGFSQVLIWENAETTAIPVQGQ